MNIITSWFDIMGENNVVFVEEDNNFDDMDENANRIKEITRNEVKNVGVDYKRIFIGGFSQGAYLPYHIGFNFEHTLGGIILLCGMPDSKTTIQEGNKNF